MSALVQWWEELGAAALVGTARRPVPPLPDGLPERPDASRETALLDAAALGGALRRAGTRTLPAAPAEPAPRDAHEPAPARAVQLLELLLHQSPVGPQLAPHLVRRWLEAAAARGRRAPHHVLPDLLDLATGTPDLRPAVRPVADARGAWLALANPAWGWVLEPEPEPVAPEPVDPQEWAARGPGDRAALLAGADEVLLEQALDDRAARVRETAQRLLDAHPGSRRAARMADRLRPLVRSTRREVEVELPLDPDPAGVRDGLTRPKRVGSVRGWWLQRMTAGAPLDVWTDATGKDPATTWRRITSPDVRTGIAEAVLARGDRDWAAAIVADVWRPDLVALVPDDLRDRVAADQLERATTGQQVVAVVSAVPVPWGPGSSRALLRRLGTEQRPALLLTQLGTKMALGLDPVTRPALEAWARTLDHADRERLSRTLAYLALVPDTEEAFSD